MSGGQDTSRGPLAGSEQYRRQEAGKPGAVPAHLGSAGWPTGTEQCTVWTEQREPGSEAARQSRERQQSGGRLRRETLGPICELGSHDSSEDRWTWESSLPGQEGVHVKGNVLPSTLGLAGAPRAGCLAAHWQELTVTPGCWP